jgi:hypothetical protein
MFVHVCSCLFMFVHGSYPYYTLSLIDPKLNPNFNSYPTLCWQTLEDRAAKVAQRDGQVLTQLPK